MNIPAPLLAGALAVCLVGLVCVVARPTLGFFLLMTIHVVKGALRMRFPALMEGFTYDMAIVALLLPASMLYRYRMTKKLSLDLPLFFVACWVLFALLMWLRLPGSHAMTYGFKKCLIFSVFTTMACLSCVYYCVSAVELRRLTVVIIASGAAAMIAVTFFGQAMDSYKGARIVVAGSGPLGLANLGGQMIILLFAIWILRPRMWTIVIASGLTLLGIYGIFLTGTRGPLIAIAGCLPFLLWFARRRLRPGMAIGLLLAGLVVSVVSARTITTEMLFRFSGKRIDEGIATRMYMISNSMKGFLRSPIIGTGTGDTAFQLKGFDAEYYPHNHIVEVANELGVMGLALYVIMFVYGFRTMKWMGKKRWDNTSYKNAGLPILLGCLFYVAISFKMGTYAVNYMGYIFLVILVQLDYLRIKEMRAHPVNMQLVQTPVQSDLAVLEAPSIARR